MNKNEIFAFIIMITIILTAMYKIDKYKCETKAEIQNLEPKYSLIAGCIVKYNNQWIDYDRLRYLGD